MSDLAGWVDEWDLVLSNGNLAEQTRVVYLRGVHQFLTHLAEQYPDVTKPADLGRRHVDSWLRAMTEAGRSENTRRIRLKALRLWLDYIASEPYSGLTANPAAAVPLPAEYVKPVPIVPDETVAAVLATATGPSFADRRDTAMVRMLFDCGLRRGELVALDLEDLDLKRREATVWHGKGNKARVVPFGNRTALALSRYLRARAQHKGGSTSPALFLAVRESLSTGSPWRLTGKGVAEMLDRRCQLAGVPRIHAHAFRHGWAHDLLAAGANESDVERLAGWSSPLMVRRYGNSAADARAREAHRRLARGDRL